jgi:hypothetical protein
MSTSGMTERIAEASPRFYARIAGFLYLIVIVGGLFAEIFVRGRLVVWGRRGYGAQHHDARAALSAGSCGRGLLPRV